MFNAAKDALSSQAARHYVNGLIKRYGQVRELKIDSRAKTVDIVCDLIGETQPLAVRVDRYQIIEENGRRWVEITACSCPRPWLKNLLQDHACGRRIELPGWAASAL